MIIEAILIGTFLIAVMLFLAAMFEVRHRMAERRATVARLGKALRRSITSQHLTGPHPRHDIPTAYISETGRATYNAAADDIFRRCAEQVESERATDNDPHLGA